MPANEPSVPKNGISNRQLFDLLLADQEIAGALITIAAYLIVIYSAYQDKLKILYPEAPVSPARTAAKGSLLVFLGGLILANVAFLRLEEMEEDVERGASSSSLIPNIEIVQGYIISVIGNVLKLIGAEQRAEEEGGQIAIM